MCCIQTCVMLFSPTKRPISFEGFDCAAFKVCAHGANFRELQYLLTFNVLNQVQTSRQSPADIGRNCRVLLKFGPGTHLWAQHSQTSDCGPGVLTLLVRWTESVVCDLMFFPPFYCLIHSFIIHIYNTV